MLTQKSGAIQNTPVRQQVVAKRAWLACLLTDVEDRHPELIPYGIDLPLESGLGNASLIVDVAQAWLLHRRESVDDREFSFHVLCQRHISITLSISPLRSQFPHSLRLCKLEYRPHRSAGS